MRRPAGLRGIGMNPTTTRPTGRPNTEVAHGTQNGPSRRRNCRLDAKGDVVEEGRLATSPTAFRRRFSSRTPARVAIEAGAQSAWVARLLKDCGHEVLVADPRKVRLIYQNDRETDRIDAHNDRVGRDSRRPLRLLGRAGTEAGPSLA